MDAFSRPDGYYGIVNKICPLDGRELSREFNYECYCTDCDKVSNDRWWLVYGHKCYCNVQENRLKRWYEKKQETARQYERLSSSLECARSIDIKEFYEYCDSLYKEAVETRQYYDSNMVLNPFHEPQDKCLICIFEDDKMKEIGVTENVFAYLGRRNDRIKDLELKTAVSCIAVPGYMAEAICVNFHLRNGFDVKSILHADNPVYLKRRDVGKYIDAAYGWKWLEFQKLRDQYLSMTEIVNYDNIIYIKQELDEIIRRDGSCELKKGARKPREY